MSTSTSSGSSYSINSSTSGSGTTRVTGLYSSMNIDSLVKASLTTEQSRIDKVKQTIQKDQWKETAYQNVNTTLSTFQDAYLNSENSTSTTSLALASVMNAKTVALSGTNTSAISVTATSDAVFNDFTISSCTKATKAHLETAFSATGSTAVTDMTIADVISQLGATVTTTKDTDNNECVSFSINDKSFTMKTSATVTSMLKAINNTSGIGATMYYSALYGKFELNSSSTGSNATAKITDTSGFLTGTKGLFGTGDANGTITDAGTNASIVVGGKTTTSQTNAFVVDGYSFTINGDCNTDIGVSATTDVDSIYKRITAFVDSYNTMITSLHATLDEEADSDYEPLTDAEKADMTDATIEKWETKAKVGLLSNDANLTRLLTSVRSAISTMTSSSGLNLATIGITTGTYKTCPNGQLVIDASKLKAAISNDSAAVSDLFTKTVKFGTADTKYAGSGLIYKINSLVSDYTKKSTDVTIANLKTAVTRLQDNETALESSYTKKEDALYTKYSALETQLAAMSSSSSMFSSSSS